MARKKQSTAVLQALVARLDGVEDAKVSDFEETLIKSKDRVNQHGEVFTPANIVRDMLDLIPQLVPTDTSTSLEDKLNYTVFEPSCGNGNFLVEVLTRKLEVAFNLPLEDLLINIFKSVATIYGVDIQQDNVIESRERLLKHILKTCKDDIVLSDKYIKMLKHIIAVNIQWGNTLTYTCLESGDEAPLLITDWVFTDTSDSIKVTTHQSYLSDLDTVISTNEMSIER